MCQPQIIFLMRLRSFTLAVAMQLANAMDADGPYFPMGINMMDNIGRAGVMALDCTYLKMDHAITGPIDAVSKLK